MPHPTPPHPTPPMCTKTHGQIKAVLQLVTGAFVYQPTYNWGGAHIVEQLDTRKLRETWSDFRRSGRVVLKNLTYLLGIIWVVLKLRVCR